MLYGHVTRIGDHTRSAKPGSLNPAALLQRLGIQSALAGQSVDESRRSAARRARPFVVRPHRTRQRRPAPLPRPRDWQRLQPCGSCRRHASRRPRAACRERDQSPRRAGNEHACVGCQETARRGPRAGPHASAPADQKSNCTLKRMNRGRSTAVGCIHLAPFVAGSYTVSYVVGVFEFMRL